MSKSGKFNCILKVFCYQKLYHKNFKVYLFYLTTFSCMVRSIHEDALAKSTLYSLIMELIYKITKLSKIH